MRNRDVEAAHTEWAAPQAAKLQTNSPALPQS